MNRNLFFFSFFMVLLSCAPNITVVDDYVKSDNADLKMVSIDSVELIDFSPNVYEYTLDPVASSSISVYSSPFSTKSSVYGNGNISLDIGVNTFTISVISESEKASKFYTFKIVRYDNQTTLLKNIKVDGVVIDDFSEEKDSYSYLTSNKTVTITAEAINPSAVVTLDGIYTLDETTDYIKAPITVTAGGSTGTYDVYLKYNSSTGGSGGINIVDLSYEFQQDGYKTVIFGDSISVGYGFFGTSDNPAEASSSYPGKLAWPHMMRDAILRNDPYFVHADQTMIYSKYNDYTYLKSWSTSSDPSASYYMPFNNRNMVLGTTHNDEEIIFSYDHQNSLSDKIVLYFSKTPQSVGCSFDIYLDDVLVIDDFDTASHNTSYYMGYDMVVAEIDCTTLGTRNIKLTDFNNTAGGSTMAFFFLGIGSKYSPVYLTGRSGATTEFYTQNSYQELTNRVLTYNPDCSILMIGANDSSNPSGIPNGTVSISDFQTNIENLVDQMRAVNKYMQIVLMGPPLWEGVDEDLIKSYSEVLENVAIEKNCAFIDTIEVFENMPSTNEYLAEWRDWRTDDIHLSKYGNTVLTRTFLNYIMPQGVYPMDMVDAEKIFIASNNFYMPQHGIGYIQYNSSTGKFDITGGFIRGHIQNVSKVSGQSRLQVTTFNTSYSDLTLFDIEQYGSNYYEFYTRLNTYAQTSQDFWILKRGYQSNGTSFDYILSESDFTTYEDYLKFVIAW